MYEITPEKMLGMKHTNGFLNTIVQVVHKMISAEQAGKYAIHTVTGHTAGREIPRQTNFGPWHILEEIPTDTGNHV